MDLKDFFKIQSKAVAVKWGVPSPSVEVQNSPKSKRMSTGVRTIFDFDSFKFIITYLESGRAAYAQQTMWLSVSLEDDLVLPYSIYDVLAFCEPENFNSYTYTYVDSKELMIKCFEEIEELVSRIVPEFSELLSNGITRNRFISTQKQTINKYFGDNVIESSELVGGAADKLISLMLDNFYQAQIESAVIGSQSLFYRGSEEKALKRLRKAKCRTLYQENLMKYIENGGKREVVSNAVSEASAEKGCLRHNKDSINEDFKAIFGIILCTALVSLLLGGIYLFAIKLLFSDAQLVLGIKENLTVFPFVGLLVSVPVTLNILSHKKIKKNTGDIKKVYSVTLSENGKKLVKYFTIIAEALAVIMVFFSVFSTTVFKEDKVMYTEEDFPLSFEECSYDAIEEIAIVKGYYYKDEYVDEEYITFKTISDRTADLYNSTFKSADIIRENKEFFENKGIEVREQCTINN